VQIQEVDGDLAKAFAMEKAHGGLVGDVEPGGPADKAGIKAGDIIVAVDDQPVIHAHDLPRLVARHRPGTHVKLKFLRDKSELTVDVARDALKDESAEGPKVGPQPGSEGQASLGLAVKDAPGGGAQVDRIFPGTPAVGQLQPGDVIVEVNHSPVANAAQVTKALRSLSPGQTILLKVRSDGKVRFVALTRPLKQQSP
jgi:serine protease Do